MLKMYKSKHYDKKYLNSTTKKVISLSPNALNWKKCSCYRQVIEIRYITLIEK